MYKILILFTLCAMSCQVKSQRALAAEDAVKEQQYTPKAEFPEEIVPVEKSYEEWEQELTRLEYSVLRNAGTERAFSGDLWNNKEDGVYSCRGCGLALFDSNTKYKSGTGWPSFYQPIKPEYVGEDTDYKLGYARTEVHCARCEGHLGHVFRDGPRPTGLRYCMNSVSMDFVPRIDDVTKVE